MAPWPLEKRVGERHSRIKPIHMTTPVAHYTGAPGQRYFEERLHRLELSTQRRLGALLFQPYIGPGYTVVDFGCGTGGILRSLRCGRRIGVEVNEIGARQAIERGIEVHRDMGEIADKSADVVISHHALEHTAEPYRIMLEFARILRPQGKLILVVPCEPGRRRQFRRWHEQLDKHLFSWNPLALGNLATACGFRVIDSFVRTNGYSRWNRWLLPAPAIFVAVERLTAYILGRHITVCVALKK
jgi:SAM-dependent methyltransferase